MVIDASTIGIRAQITLPKKIRDKAVLQGKRDAFIFCENNKLLISKSKPEGVYNLIRISEKGQFVIPKNLRISLSLKENDLMIFELLKDVIIIEKLFKRGKFDKFYFLQILYGIIEKPIVIENNFLVLDQKLSGEQFDLLERLFESKAILFRRENKGKVLYLLRFS